MRKFIAFCALALVFATVTLPARTPAATPGSAWVIGSLVHASSTNVKVIDYKIGKELSFLLPANFNQIFSADGRTQYQLSALRRDEMVKVYYDPKNLGPRYAERIEVLNGRQSENQKP